MTADPRVAEALAWLEAKGSEKVRAQARDQFGIVAPRAFGVRMSEIHALAKRLGRDPALAAALWETGWYEARLLCAFVDDPAALTSARMDRWARDFDNWAVCDTLCFQLFDRSPHAWERIAPWARRKDEFVRRAAFALIASLAAHDKAAGDERFAAVLPLVEGGATDPRNFVKKGVSWALRGIGHRSAALHTEAVALARRLAASEDAAARWVGKDALRDLTRPAVLSKVAARRSKRR